MNFNFQVPDEKEAKESISEDEADPGVFSDTPSFVPLPNEAEVPAEAGSPISPIGLRLLTCTALRLALLRLLVALPQTFRPLCIIFAYFG